MRKLQLEPPVQLPKPRYTARHQAGVNDELPARFRQPDQVSLGGSERRPREPERGQAQSSGIVKGLERVLEEKLRERRRGLEVREEYAR